MKKTAVKYGIFALYILIVLKLTLLRETTLDNYEINFTPFVELINVYRTSSTWQFLRLFLGNIGWFIPFGFILPLMMKKSNFLTVTLMGCGFSFLIEILQLALKKGYCELDDLILNTLGAVIGYAMYKIIKNIWKYNRG